ncbi:MAG TPA: AAA family ATPase [Anaerohalosphaeraceae bacterium]|nr:AAA family ATPase [Anaerohalosphaeraceae bacterium]HOL87739.1 AAA family ATPase [Anaerohalosphaeraceae bacterium]HPP55754.1 AAA family ATPase [Anaerohalosphaeraceae bacterium]
MSSSEESISTPSSCRILAVLNQKGGVGKTTTVANLSAVLAQSAKRTLVIDLDPQAHLTIHLGADAETPPSGSYAVLTGAQSLEEVLVQSRPNLWLLSSGIDLVGAETELVNEVGRETILRNALQHIRERFDYIFIDCPPSLGLLTLNALAAADEVLIPIQPHFLALQGFGRLLQTIRLVNQRINPALRVKAILMCMYDSRASLSVEVKNDIEKFLESARQNRTPWSGASVVPVQIRRNIKLAEAPSYGKTIFEYEPSCHGADDYRAVAQYLFGQISAEPQPVSLGDTPACEQTDAGEKARDKA